MPFCQSHSPRLPVFGIRNLTGPENPPGLISITSREYDSTIQSEPSAKLLYLDDDDGELITVGSALELSQRLEDPVSRYFRSSAPVTRNPLDGNLVHVFDINRTPGSLIAWTDHEAYSSKKLRRSTSSSQLSDSPFADPVESIGTLPWESCDFKRETVSDEVTSAIVQNLPAPKTQEVDNVNTQTKNILDGIEEHLSGLANVLQIAATTLQKAADKTGQADTSVVEDILKGVKNILTDVGSFGLEAYKAFETETSEGSSWLTPTESEPPVSEDADEQTPSDEAVSEPEYLALDEADRPSKPISIVDARPSPRVKFAATVTDVVDEIDCPAESPVSSTLDEDAESFSEKRKRDEMGECERIVPITNPSILDDGNEDADFTARYPPLMSIRRAHTLNGHYTRDNLRGSRRNERDSYSPSYKPTGGQDLVSQPSQSTDKAENAESTFKPIPGAWPHQMDTSSVMPPAVESSGAFFNRMTGRDRTKDTLSGNLQRANTTAASNPASRLNGPFDPISVYQSPESGTIEIPFRPRRSFVSSNHMRYQPPWARSAQDDFAPGGFNAWKNYLQDESEKDLRSKRSLPAMRYDPQSEGGEKSGEKEMPNRIAINNAETDLHRILRHHHSVPHFQIPTSRPHADGFTIRDLSSRPQPELDLLTGPAPPIDVASPGSKNFDSQLAAATSKYPDLTTPPQEANSLSNSKQPQSPPRARRLAKPYHSHSFSNRTSQAPNTFNASAAPFQPSTISSQSRAEEGRASNFQWNYQPPPPQPFRYTTNRQPKPARSSQNKFDQCVDQLKTLGFGVNDNMLRDRLHVYAVAANGNVFEAVEMIEEDRRVSANFC